MRGVRRIWNRARTASRCAVVERAARTSQARLRESLTAIIDERGRLAVGNLGEPA
jgi:hypothetical protein